MAEQKPELTPAYRLFKIYYTCHIPAAYAYEKQHAMVGQVQYQNAEQEQQAGQELVARQHTVVEMIEYHRRGAQVVLNNAQDAVTIYRDLREHLSGMREKMRFSVNHKFAPLEDLKAMDAFAAMIYRIARRYDEQPQDVGGMSRRMDDLFGKRRMMRRRAREEEREKLEQAEQYPEGRPAKEHESIADDISREALERGLPSNR